MEKFRLRFFHLENILILFILAIAAFLRLYRISDYLTFLGDEGRDVLVVKRILEGNLTLLGPRASAGDFFLGPIYYYFMAPFLYLWHLDPVGPAIMIGILGVITVWLTWHVGRIFFGGKAALFAATLYAVSPVVIAYSRSSWNPNPMPFFSLLILYLVYKACSLQSTRLFWVIGILFGITMQLHYLATFLGVIIGVYVVIANIVFEKSQKIKKILVQALQLFLGFLIGFSPFIAFEVKHSFPNIKTIFAFIFHTTLQEKYVDSSSFFAIVNDVFFRLFGRLATRYPPPEQVVAQPSGTFVSWYSLTLLLAIISIALFLYSFFVVYKKRNILKIRQYMLIAIWLILGITLFGFYKKPIYDYYFGFMFPLPFLLIGNALSDVTSQKKTSFVGIVVGTIVFVYLLLFNLQGAPFFSLPNRQKDQVKMIADFVLSKTDEKPYNFALITQGNSDHGYRYFFEIAKHPPVTIEFPGVDPQKKTVTGQLLIVCEDISCQPLGNSLWEVAGFGRAEIAGHWDVSVVKVYKLVHYSEKKIDSQQKLR